MGAGLQRGLAVLLLVVAGVASLPLAAAVLDGEGTENWIIPAQLVGMLALGALVGVALPALGGASTDRARSARMGTAYGFGAALLGLVLFWLLLNGIDGA
jgi:hypothetical protein